MSSIITAPFCRQPFFFFRSCMRPYRLDYFSSIVFLPVFSFRRLDGYFLFVPRAHSLFAPRVRSARGIPPPLAFFLSLIAFPSPVPLNFAFSASLALALLLELNFSDKCPWWLISCGVCCFGILSAARFFGVVVFLIATRDFSRKLPLIILIVCTLSATFFRIE